MDWKRIGIQILISATLALGVAKFALMDKVTLPTDIKDPQAKLALEHANKYFVKINELDIQAISFFNEEIEETKKGTVKNENLKKPKKVNTALVYLNFILTYTPPIFILVYILGLFFFKKKKPKTNLTQEMQMYLDLKLELMNKENLRKMNQIIEIRVNEAVKEVLRKK